MPPVRKPKSPVSAWIVEQRTRQEWKSEELARRLSVSDSTVRGWEAGRSVSDPNLRAMERLFGVQAPGTKETGQADVVGLVDMLTRALQLQAEALTEIRLVLTGAVESADQQRDETAALLGDLRHELEQLRTLAGNGTGSAELESGR